MPVAQAPEGPSLGATSPWSRRSARQPPQHSTAHQRRSALGRTRPLEYGRNWSKDRRCRRSKEGSATTPGRHAFCLWLGSRFPRPEALGGRAGHADGLVWRGPPGGAPAVPARHGPVDAVRADARTMAPRSGGGGALGSARIRYQNRVADGVGQVVRVRRRLDRLPSSRPELAPKSAVKLTRMPRIRLLKPFRALSGRMQDVGVWLNWAMDAPVGFVGSMTLVTNSGAFPHSALFLPVEPEQAKRIA